MKRYMALLTVLALLFTSTFVYAGFTDVTGSSNYADAVNRVNALGIMDGTGQTTFGPQEYVTREQFAVLMVRAAGLKDTAEASRGSAVFSDVDPKSAASGYISVALDKGYITGMPDGKFHPKDRVTFAQVSTVAVKALGYTDQDVPGLWPKNYMEKAKTLGLTTGINLKSSDGVQRGAMALVIDRLLNMNMKNSNASDQNQTFANAVGLYTECIILGTSLTSDKLADNQIMTDKGIFYLEDTDARLELGNTYRLHIQEDAIKVVLDKVKVLENISVDSSVDTKVSYRVGDEMKDKVLPEKTVYYYQGAKQSYDNLKNIIQARSSIVLAGNKGKTGYEYAVVFDPVYSKPEVARNFQPSSRKIGKIGITDSSIVVRNGVLSNILQIMEKDVVYEVSDIWKQQKYILAMNDRVGGKITAILPNKLSPKTLQIGGTNYEFSSALDFTKLNYAAGSFQVDDNVVALMGYDGRIVDLEYPGSESNSSFALVLSTTGKISTNTNGTLSYAYTAKLLTGDGITATYNTTADASQYKGKLVKMEKVDSQKVALSALSYDFPKQVVVNKLDRTISGDYFADNAKIFNIISNDSGGEVEASLLDFKDLPEGAVTDGKVYFMNKTGAFNDVNVMLTNDILDQKYKTAIIKSMNIASSRGTYSYSYTLLVQGREYQYNQHINNADVGSVVKVQFSGGEIVDVNTSVRNADLESTSVQAFDARRIKINNKVYWFNKSISVYFRDYSGNVTAKSIADLSVNELYGSVSLYLDRAASQGGKVEIIVVKQ